MASGRRIAEESLAATCQAPEFAGSQRLASQPAERLLRVADGGLRFIIYGQHWLRRRAGGAYRYILSSFLPNVLL